MQDWKLWQSSGSDTSLLLQGAQVQSLLGELGCHSSKLCAMAKNPPQTAYQSVASLPTFPSWNLSLSLSPSATQPLGPWGKMP